MTCKQHPNDPSSRAGVCASCLRHRLSAQSQAAQPQRECRKPDPPPPPSFPRSVSPYISRSGKVGRFASLLSGLFRSKPVKPESDSGPVEPFSAVSGGRKKNASAAAGGRRRIRDRGMSPARCSEDEDELHCGGGGYSSEKRTPARWTAAPHSKSISGFAVCLSPMVRASPNRNWSQKGFPPEMVVAGGESRVPPKPHLSTAASFCKNRSRKLADFGRYTYDPTR